MFCTSAPAVEKKEDSEGLLSYIRALELTEAKDDDASGNSAQVNAGALISFTSTCDAQQTEDVQNSCLLAQQAANIKYDRTSQTEEWYDYYQDVLSHVGWVMQSMDFEIYSSEAVNIAIPDFVITIISDMVEGNEIKQMVTDTIASLKSDDGAKANTLFAKSSNTQNGANFQILACNSVNGQVTTAFIGSHITGTQLSEDYFFVTYKSASLKVYYNCQVMTLNESVYETVRTAVKNKLGTNANKFVEDLPDLS